MAALPLERGYLSSPEELIDAARNGRMFILVDDEDGRMRAISSSPRKWRLRTRSTSWPSMAAASSAWR
jgi:hypothetical protein